MQSALLLQDRDVHGRGRQLRVVRTAECGPGDGVENSRQEGRPFSEGVPAGNAEALETGARKLESFELRGRGPDPLSHGRIPFGRTAPYSSSTAQGGSVFLIERIWKRARPWWCA